MIIIIAAITGIIITTYLFYSIRVIYTLKKENELIISPSIKSTTTVDVAIVCRNEEKYIANLLACLAKQSYPKHLFSISIIDDHSTDNTVTIIENFIVENPLLNINYQKLTNRTITKNFKKNALQQIALQSQAELIVCTDADTYMGNQWLHSLVAFYNQHSYSFIAAPVNLVATKKTFLSQLDAFEHIALQAYSLHGIVEHKATMCNGANLCYKREIFLTVGGYDTQSTSASGDDLFLLFAFKNSNTSSIGWCNNPNAMVFTYANEYWNDFLQQKLRWTSKAKLYKDKDIVFLSALIGITNSTIVLLLICTFFYIKLFPLFSIAIITKVFIDILVIKKADKLYKQNIPFLYMFMYGLIYPFYSFVIIILSRYLKPIWKGRVIN